MVVAARCIENRFPCMMRLVSQLVLCVCCLLPAVAEALEPERYVLPNGLEVILRPDPGAGSVGLAVQYHVGSRDDPPGYHGLAHLVEHMTFRGSRHLPDSLLAPLLEAGVSTYNGVVSSDTTTYFEIVPAQQLPLALWVESERMAFSLERFDARMLELERGIVLRERGRGRDNRYPRFVAETLYPIGHPYRALHRLASSEDSLELDHARWFFQRWYYPKNATLLLSGGFDRDRAKALIAQYFGSVSNPAVPTLRSVADAVVFDGAETITFATQAKRSQVHMLWSIPCTQKPCAAATELYLLAELLTGNREALLTHELVQERGLAASADVRVAIRERHIELYLDVTLAMNIEHARVIDAVDAVVRRLQRDGISREALRLARLRILTSKAREREVALAKLAEIAGMSSRSRDFEPEEQRNRRLLSLTPADVQRALRTHLRLDRRLILESHAELNASREANLIGRKGALRSRSVR